MLSELQLRQSLIELVNPPVPEWLKRLHRWRKKLLRNAAPAAPRPPRALAVEELVQLIDDADGVRYTGSDNTLPVALVQWERSTEEAFVAALELVRATPLDELHTIVLTARFAVDHFDQSVDAAIAKVEAMTDEERAELTEEIERRENRRAGIKDERPAKRPLSKEQREARTARFYEDLDTLDKLHDVVVSSADAIAARADTILYWSRLASLTAAALADSHFRARRPPLAERLRVFSSELDSLDGSITAASNRENREVAA
jgi:hypothetical protein